MKISKKKNKELGISYEISKLYCKILFSMDLKKTTSRKREKFSSFEDSLFQMEKEEEEKNTFFESSA